MPTLRAAFVMEQHVGHRTFTQNLRRFAGVDARLEAHWVEITYWEAGHAWERLPLPANLKGTLRGAWQTRRGLASFPWEVAFFNTQAPAVFASDWLGRRPCVISTDITPLQYDRFAANRLFGSDDPNRPGYAHRPDRLAALRRFKYTVNRRVFQRAAHVVAWSNWVCRSLQSDYGVRPENISIIPPGVDLALWTPSGEASEKAGRPVRILFVGSDFRRKGGPLLLEAYQRLSSQRTETPGRAELHLVTDEQVPSVRSEPLQPGLHVYHGLSPNSPALRHIFQHSDIFVLPSYAEAFGIAAVEACASGLPVVVANTGGLSDTVEDEKTGFLIPVGDVEALTQALARLAAEPDLRRQMGQAGRALAEQRFDARANAFRLVTLLADKSHPSESAQT